MAAPHCSRALPVEVGSRVACARRFPGWGFAFVSVIENPYPRKSIGPPQPVGKFNLVIPLWRGRRELMPGRLGSLLVGASTLVQIEGNDCRSGLFSRSLRLRWLREQRPLWCRLRIFPFLASERREPPSFPARPKAAECGLSQFCRTPDHPPQLHRLSRVAKENW